MSSKKSTQYAVRSTQCAMRGPWLTRLLRRPAMTGSPLHTAYCALITVYCILSLGCAQIVTPDGGPKDTTPPHAVHYSPDSAATNFHGTKIVITFNEYISLNDLNKQLIISPAVKRKPEVTVRKKDLVIQFKDTLEPNTTYSISFGKAIRDITESNVLNNFRYVFSTGPYIDSLKCSGRVVNAQNLRGEKNVLVMLYRNTSDSAPYREKPYYYTRTDDDGNFMLTNLAAATYRIFALADEGEDYLFNTPDERIAFSDSLLHLTGSVDSLRMLMFKERPSVQKLVKENQLSAGRFRFNYALPIENPSVTFNPPLPASMEAFVAFNETKDTIDVWLSKIEIDSVQFVIKSGDKTLDEIPMKLDKPGQKKQMRAGTSDFRALVLRNNAAGGKLIPGEQFTIISTNPIRSIDTSRIVFMQGKDTLDPKVVLAVSKRKINFNVPFVEDSSYRVFIPPGAIIDWYGQKNDTIKTGFSVVPQRMFGNLSIKLPTLAPGKYLLEVLDEKDNVLRDTLLSGPGVCSFTVLPAGNYRFRMIYDADGDGRWTAGNYFLKRQPEKVIYYQTAVRIRAGWDMDIEWRL